MLFGFFKALFINNPKFFIHLLKTDSCFVMVREPSVPINTLNTYSKAKLDEVREMKRGSDDERGGTKQSSHKRLSSTTSDH